MLNLLNASGTILFGSETFGYGYGPVGNPAIFIFGFPIYLYALIIVSGMGVAIFVASRIFKQRGYDPYDITIYCLIAIPIAILGARAYVYIFPWSGKTLDWSTYFNFRSGGLGIYGGVMAGMATIWVTTKVRKQDYRIVADAIYPGMILAQSIGRWGNFVNQEAYGNLVTNPNLQFFPYAVYIDGSGWHQATFFYESFCTLVGFLIMILVLNRNKHYKLGWNAAFYGIYYGAVRLVIEGLRTDSLYLYIGSTQTDIRISQLVSIFAIIAGVITLTQIYRKELHALYRKLFSSEREEVSKSRFVLLGVALVLFAVSAFGFISSSEIKLQSGNGGESMFILGTCFGAGGIYATLGIFSCNDRLKLYCKHCGKRLENVNGYYKESTKLKTNIVMYCIASVVLLGLVAICLSTLSVESGKVTNPNNIVLAVLLAVVLGYTVSRVVANVGKYNSYMSTSPTESDNFNVTCCGEVYSTKLSTIWLFIFPFKNYLDYGVENLKPYVEVPEEKPAKAK